MKYMLLAFLLMGLHAQANLIVVNSNQDTVAVDGDCTLREALTAANFDIFVADCNATGLGDDLIWVLLGTSGDAIQLDNQLGIIDGVTIQGPGADNLVLFPANGHSGHIFQINTDRDVILQDFRIGGAQSSAVDVVNVRDLEIANMEFHNNQAGSNEYGGAIQADVEDGHTLSISSLMINNVLFQSNSADYGGAVAAGGTYDFSVNNSEFISNTASSIGAAIYRYYRGFDSIDTVFTTIKNSQFKENSCSNGTVSVLQQTLDVSESLFQNNSGITTINALNTRGAIRNSIFTGRTSGRALTFSGYPTALVSIISVEFNTFINKSSAVDIQVGNYATASIRGNAFAGSNITSCQEINSDTLISNGYNLEAVGASCTFHIDDLPATNAELLPLGLYGGEILIVPPTVSSPLVDTAMGCNSNDISGIGRPYDGNGDGTSECDIGAVELPEDFDYIFINGFE